MSDQNFKKCLQEKETHLLGDLGDESPDQKKQRLKQEEHDKRAQERALLFPHIEGFV